MCTNFLHIISQLLLLRSCCAYRQLVLHFELFVFFEPFASLLNVALANGNEKVVNQYEVVRGRLKPQQQRSTLTAIDINNNENKKGDDLNHQQRN